MTVHVQEDLLVATFDLSQWCDFARGVIDPETAARMEEQLATGSDSARRTATALRRVAAVGREDHRNRVPEHALRLAKAIGSLRRHAGGDRPSLLHRLPFRLAFDSWREPAPAGTRDLQTLHRQMVFEAGELSVEVRLERELDPPGTVVVGQVLRRTDGGVEPLPRMPVVVLADERVAGRALSGRFGEFQAEGLPREPLRLCLLTAADRCLELPLDAEHRNDEETDP